MARVTVTSNGVDELAAALDAAAEEVTPELRKVGAKGALNIKRGWQDRWRNLTGLQDLPRTITYDTSVRGTLVTVEVGPDHRRGGQAALAHIPEYGLAKPRTPARPGGRPALEAELPNVERYAAELGARLLP